MATFTAQVSPYKKGYSSLRINDQYRLEFREKVNPNNILEIEICVLYYNSKRPVTTDFALFMEATLGIPAYMLVGMQTDYNLQVAQTIVN